MYCIKCGQLLPNEAKFCSNCGCQISADVSNINDEVFAKATDIVVTDEIMSLDSQEIVDDVISKAHFIGDDKKMQENIQHQPSITIQEQPTVEQDVEIEEKTEYPIETEESSFGGAITIKEIAYSENDVIYRVYDNNGVFSEEFTDIEECKTDFLLIAQCLKDNLFVLLQIDVVNKKVFYATDDRYKRLDELKEGLYRCHGGTTKYNKLLHWDSVNQKVVKIYETLCWIDYLDGSDYKLCRSNNDYWLYGIIRYEYGKIRTIMPVICEEVYSCNEDDYIAKVTYNKHTCYISKDGWLYRYKHPIIAYIILVISIVMPFAIAYLTANGWYLFLYFFSCGYWGSFVDWKTAKKVINIKLLLQRLDGYLKKINDNPECKKDVIAEIEDKEHNILDNIEFWYIDKDLTIYPDGAINKKSRKSLWVKLSILIIIVLSIIGMLIFQSNAKTTSSSTVMASDINQENIDDEELQTYTDDYYGFSVKFPAYLKVKEQEKYPRWKKSNEQCTTYISDDKETELIIKCHIAQIFSAQTYLENYVRGYAQTFDENKNIYICPDDPNNITNWIVASGYLADGRCLYDKTIIANRKSKEGRDINIIVSVIVTTTDKNSAKIAYCIKDYFKVDEAGAAIDYY